MSARANKASKFATQSEHGGQRDVASGLAKDRSGIVFLKAMNCAAVTGPVSSPQVQQFSCP